MPQKINEIVEKNNINYIENLISNNFSLEPESEDFFVDYLNNPQKRFINDFEKVYKSEDLRIRYKINYNILATIDEQWKNFQDSFPSFCKKLKIDYIQFSSGIILYNKNQVKLRKALIDFYNDKKNFIYAWKDFYFINAIKKYTYSSSSPYLYFYVNNEFSLRDQSYFKNIKSLQTITKYIQSGHIVKSDRVYNEINYAISNTMERINRLKFLFNPKKKSYEVVISANFADWLLCSTGESWSSCLNLESDYRYSFWAGLPSLIADKNRLMIYITDGRRKKYNGIEVDRVLARSWLLLTKVCQEKRIFINTGYPNQYHKLYKNIVNRAFKLKNLKTFNGEYRNVEKNIKYETYYSIPFFWQEINNDNIITCSSYNDNGFMEPIAGTRTYKITNIHSSNTISDENIFYCLKRRDTHLNKLYGKFDYSQGLTYLDSSYNQIGDFFTYDDEDE